MKKQSAFNFLLIAIFVLISISCSDIATLFHGQKPEDSTPTHIITFYSNGGSDIDAITVKYGTMATPPSIPSRAGYTFSGWYRDNETFNLFWDFSVSIVIDDINLFAKWTANTYIVSFDPTDGTGGPAQKNAVFGSPLPNLGAEQKPQRGDYHFGGYYNIDETMYYTADFTPAKDHWDDADNITLYAHWTEILEATIIFHSNNANNQTRTQSVGLYNSEDLMLNTFIGIGYLAVFTGWSTSPAGSLEYTDGQEFTVEALTVNLYAVWREYTIGETGPGGGRVFYRTSGGFTFYRTRTDTVGVTRHYLEVAPVNASSGTHWGTSVDLRDLETAIGTGLKNNLRILQQNPQAGASAVCRNYTNNGFNDWFLPSQNELTQLYNNRTAVGISHSSFNNAYYWASNQGTSASTAQDGRWRNFYSGDTNLGSKSLMYIARPVRAF